MTARVQEGPMPRLGVVQGPPVFTPRRDKTSVCGCTVGSSAFKTHRRPKKLSSPEVPRSGHSCSALYRALRRMAGLVFLLVSWVLAAGGRLPKARRGRFFSARVFVVVVVHDAMDRGRRYDTFVLA